MGGGKTWSILADNLQGVHDPDYLSVFFRTNTTEITKGLWPEAKKMYMSLLKDDRGKFIGKSHINEQSYTITFPSGARSVFSYLEYDKHADAWYGSELAKIYFDEFQFRTPYQFDVLRSRNRSMAKVTKGIRCTLNPDAEHFCYDWIKPYLDEEGFPIKELSGKTRYFLLVNDELYTEWDYDTLYNRFYDPSLPEDKQKKPDTYTYIPSTLEDNDALNAIDPSYRAVLDSLPEKKRKQLLLGCWTKDESTGALFQRSWLSPISKKDLPKDMKIVRAWDLAGEIPKDDNKFPDYSYGTLMGKCSAGLYYLLNGTKFQDRPGARNKKIIHQAKQDNKIWGEVTVVTAVDPGSAGKEAYQAFAAQLTQERIKCKSDPAPTNNSKFKKYEPFSDACQNGLVYICEELWDKDELDYYLRMSELFDGVTRSTARRKDDACDSSGAAFNFLDQKRVSKPLKTPVINSPTAIANRDRPIYDL